MEELGILLVAEKHSKDLSLENWNLPRIICMANKTSEMIINGQCLPSKSYKSLKVIKL